MPQQKEGKDVGYDHEGIDQVGALPDQLHGNDGTQINHQYIDELIVRNTFVSHKVFRCFFTKIRPPDQRGYGESCQGNCQKGISDVGQMGKSSGGQVSLRHA